MIKQKRRYFIYCFQLENVCNNMVIEQPPTRQPQLPEIANRFTELEQSVWNAPRPETSTIELDSTRTAQVTVFPLISRI